ncbi:MAG TPA: cytochrome c [Solirubrobacter sp.]|nr:cytochrome c [Solirubrobacter sp.]
MLAVIDRVLSWVTWLAAALVVAALFVGPELLAAEKDVDTAPAPAATGDPGEAVFAASCASCHTLAAAGASGAVGPNLDERKPDAATVSAIVTSGSGAMPSFSGRLSDAEIEAVAQYVTTNAGG